MSGRKEWYSQQWLEMHFCSSFVQQGSGASIHTPSHRVQSLCDGVKAACRNCADHATQLLYGKGMWHCFGAKCLGVVLQRTPRRPSAAYGVGIKMADAVGDDTVVFTLHDGGVEHVHRGTLHRCAGSCIYCTFCSCQEMGKCSSSCDH